MEFNKPVSNPLLVGAIELLREDETDKYRKMFWNEVLTAEYLTPVFITPPPQRGQNDRMRIPPGSNIQFPTIGTADGRHFLMAFTDQKEFDKWKPGTEKYMFALTFDDYVSMLLKKEPGGNANTTQGFIINPCSSNIVISKELIAQLIAMRN